MLYVGDEEVAAILQGYSALWHPAVLSQAASLPRLVSPYDHEQPVADALYALPDNPSLLLPDDWTGKAREVGAGVFMTTGTRETTLEHLFACLRELYPDDDRLTALMALPAERVRPFLGIGLGCAVLEALFEARSQENLLPMEDLRQDLISATALLFDADPEAYLGPLQAAADRLLAAREAIHPVNLYLIDLFVPKSDQPPEHWPAALTAATPLNVVACAALLEQIGREPPARLAELRDKVGCDLVEILGGPYREREDPLLPLESQLWNLRHGQEVYQQLLGQPISIFARERSAFHAQLPLHLQAVGISRALLVAFDDAVLPTHYAPVIFWPAPNSGKQVEGFTRSGQAADSPQTYFHLAYHLHQAMMQDDYRAALVLLHRTGRATDWYEDLLALMRLSPALGRPVTLSNYFSETTSGDYTPAASPDEFQADYLSARTTSSATGAINPVPISGFAQQQRQRRRLDAAWTFAAVLQSLGGQPADRDGQPFVEYLARLEDRLESGDETAVVELPAAMQQAGTALANRLVARGQVGNPGYLLLNPCCFPRRVVAEIDGLSGVVVDGKLVKGCQLDGTLARVVVELPPLGFAWVSSSGTGATAPPSRMVLADQRCVRNEFLEAEIDPNTGGLRAIRDLRNRISRVGQQLIYNPGSTMRAESVQTTCTGPALGEIVTTGVLLSEAGELLARFQQRFRAWVGRPLLELRIDLEPVKPLEGYPWYAYHAARFAWREEQTLLLRGSCGLRSLTMQNRPESPDFLELRLGRLNTVLFPGGLPFHQRHGSRMLDILLQCEGESARTFELGIGLEREQPAQTALGLTSPVVVVPTSQGPPHVGATGWLYLLDSANVLLTSLRPVPGHANAVVATLQESNGTPCQARLRCVRNPQRAVVQNLRGEPLYDAAVEDDAVVLDVAANDLFAVRIEFS